MSDHCCPPGSLPALTEDTARKVNGVVEKVGDLDCYYVAPPAATTKAIIVIYDVHGFSGGRIKGVCDALAASGFHVAMLDVYRGTNITEQGGFGSESGTAFLKPATANCAAMHEPLFSYLAGKGATEYGAVGFCWGAYGVVKLSSLGKLKAGVSCHPSLKVGQMFLGESEEDQVKTVKCPQMFLPAANDPDHYKDGTLKALVEATGHACVTHEFKEMKHGWVPRGDASDPKGPVARDVAAALEMAAGFFRSHL